MIAYCAHVLCIRTARESRIPEFGWPIHNASHPRRGRGALDNPKNRFTVLEYVRDEDVGEMESSSLATEVFHDTSRSVCQCQTVPWRCAQ
nr:hypothetical protein [Candidatus Entotheonella palauensis]